MFVSRTVQGSHVVSLDNTYFAICRKATQNIAEVTATGSEITCPYSAFSDDDGNQILEEDGLTSKNAKVGVLAFKTDVFDRADESIFRISTDASTPISSPSRLSLCSNTTILQSHPPPADHLHPLGAFPTLQVSEFTQADEDDNTVISKEEFVDYARSRSEYSDVFVDFR